MYHVHELMISLVMCLKCDTNIVGLKTYQPI